jgi:hypothetical protein
MLEDHHYIPNSRNAHIDTSAFERRVREELSGRRGEDALEFIYNLAFSKLSVTPNEPDEDQLVCRYLSPAKFLQFAHTRRVYFPAATQFSDPWECRVPQDYEVSILRVLYELNISAEAWSGLVKRKAACWSVSCWTQLDDPCDDHLMWDSYAGGPQGVGITVRYGVLKESLAESVKPLAADGVLHSGRVNYRALSFMPFNKHYMFRNEREVRFAFGAIYSGARCVSIDDIFGAFGVRISPAATVGHRDMVRRLWLSFGGVDRVQWPQ